MDEQDLHKINYILEELRDSQDDVSRNITDLLELVSTMEKRFDSLYNLSFVLTALRNRLESIDVDNMFDFIDDLESEVNSLSYNYKKAEKANGISTYKVTTKQMPIYFKPSL